jgi:hypothetical protein
MSSVYKILVDFRQQMILLLGDLVEVFPYEKDIVLLRLYLSEQISIQEIMENFINHVLPLKYKIKKRDTTFFLENDNIFGSLPPSAKGKIGDFRTMWLSPHLDKDDRTMIWEYFDIFIVLAEHYIERNKK